MRRQSDGRASGVDCPISTWLIVVVTTAVNWTQ